METEESVNIYFVIPARFKAENECSNDMKMAFQSCLDNEYTAHWIKEDNCSSLQPTKQDVFVFEEFKGDIFNKFQKFKCVLLGPRCLTSCLMEKCPIPESNSPVFTIAMRNLVVTLTNFVGQEKEELINKILYMGGLFSSRLITGTTHLVAKNVLSIKYEKSVERGLSVMTEQWVQAVWEASCQRNVHAADPEFEKYKSPVFYGLTITCSNLPRNVKEEMRNLITENGGTFTGPLEYGVAKLLIITNPSGDKFKYAREWKLPCVLPSWVYASVKAGYAVGVEPHHISCTAEAQGGEVRCSTPNSDESRLIPDFSIMSSISTVPGKNVLHVDETAGNVTMQSFLGKITPHKAEEVKGSSRIQALEKLNLRDAKKAGPFLDGCKVYLSGFNTDQIEKLRRILNGGGATRFNEISESVTHIIVGEIIPSDIKTLKSSGYRPYIVSVDWVVESIKRKSPAPEDLFLCSDVLLQPLEPPSPLSKKGLQMLRKPIDKPVPTLSLSDSSSNCSKEADVSEEKLPEVDDVVNHYISNVSKGDNVDAPGAVQKDAHECGVVNCVDKPLHGDITTGEDTESSQNATQFTESTMTLLFTDLRFLIIGFEEETKEKLQEAIETQGGQVVGKSFKGVADYAIVPPLGMPFSQTVSEIVSCFWVEDCLAQEELLPVAYYHQPLDIDLEKKPLTGCVIGISSYMGSERDFIFFLAQQLGAITQEMFARKANEKKNVLASTHLICMEPGSQKYNAALKWKLPAVSHEWLMACAKEARHVNEEPYLIGESTVAPISTTPKVHNVNHTTEHNKEDNPMSVIEPRDVFVSPYNVSTNNIRRISCSKDQTPRPVHRRVEVLQNPMSAPSSPRSPRRFVTPNREGGGFSQESPLNIPKIENTPKPGWPEDLSQPTPKGPFHIATPETPYGQVFKPNPSPETRKRWKKWIDNFPDFKKEETPPKKRRGSTPLSELKRQCWEKIMRKDDSNDVSSGIGCSNEKKPNNSKYQNNMTANYPSTSGNSKLAPMVTSEKSNLPCDSGRQRVIQKQLAELNDCINKLPSEARTPTMKRLSTNDSIEHVENENMHCDMAPGDRDSQGLVEWVDPIEMKQLEEGKEETEVKRIQKLKFMFSGIQDREYYEEIAVSLGGEISDKPLFDSTATHLVCNRPVRSEKLLASIASGKWVLHKSFLDDSVKSGRFLQEDHYEWGNPLAQTIMRELKLSDLESCLAHSAHRWRCKLKEEISLAFVDMKALICISPEREEPFKRLILAGGGKILEFSNLEDATHCFVELNKVSLPVDISVLVKHRIPCVPPVYLNDYLIKNPPPQPQNCLVPEYNQFLQS